MPQDSTIGPLLFLLHIDDIVVIPGTQEIVLSDNDTNVFFHGAALSKVMNQTDKWRKSLALVVYK